MAYCEVTDLLIKDFTLAPGQTYDEWVDRAADEMHAFLGYRYVIPIVPNATSATLSQHDQLVLKRINILLASGRFYLAHASNDERDRLHAYGRSLVNEAIGALTALRDGKVDLSSAQVLDTSIGDESRRMPGVINQDKTSLLAPYECEVLGLSGYDGV